MLFSLSLSLPIALFRSQWINEADGTFSGSAFTGSAIFAIGMYLGACFSLTRLIDIARDYVGTVEVRTSAREALFGTCLLVTGCSVGLAAFGVYVSYEGLLLEVPFFTWTGVALVAFGVWALSHAGRVWIKASRTGRPN